MDMTYDDMADIELAALIEARYGDPFPGERRWTARTRDELIEFLRQLDETSKSEQKRHERELSDAQTHLAMREKPVGKRKPRVRLT